MIVTAISALVLIGFDPEGWIHCAMPNGRIRIVLEIEYLTRVDQSTVL